jgi:hypothetical protein
MIRRSYEEMRRGVTIGNRNAGREQIGGTAESQQSGRAWLLVDEINRICGHAVVETQEGGAASHCGS